MMNTADTYYFIEVALHEDFGYSHPNAQDAVSSYRRAADMDPRERMTYMQEQSGVSTEDFRAAMRSVA